MSEIRSTKMDFAILDLAQDDDLLEWLYSHMQTGEIAWESLFIGTRYHPEWRCGAILIELRGKTGFQESMRQRMSRQPVGLLIASRKNTLQVMASRLREALFANVSGVEKLFRFYDPRSLSALFSILDKLQIERLLSGSDAWTWFADGHWHRIDNEATEPSAEKEPSAETEPSAEIGEPIRLTEQQVDQLALARKIDLINMLYQHYLAHLPASDPLAFVNQQVGVASEFGLTRQRDYERWIRLAIMEGGPLEHSPRWVALHQTGENPGKVLDILEVEQG